MGQPKRHHDADEMRKTTWGLLSFLGGEGGKKMHELLPKLDWPFKEHKTKETIQVLRDCMPYFGDSFAAELGVALPGTILVRDSVDGHWPLPPRYLWFSLRPAAGD